MHNDDEFTALGHNLHLDGESIGTFDDAEQCEWVATVLNAALTMQAAINYVADQAKMAKQIVDEENHPNSRAVLKMARHLSRKL